MGNLLPAYKGHEPYVFVCYSHGDKSEVYPEIAWLQDPVDVFFLHIQGSGKVILPDRSVLHVHYAASNGRPYRGIGRLLVGQGAGRKRRRRG